MTIQYFSECKTPKEGKDIYRAQALLLHPDRPTGSTEAFRELRRQYGIFTGDAIEGHLPEDGDDIADILRSCCQFDGPGLIDPRIEYEFYLVSGGEYLSVVCLDNPNVTIHAQMPREEVLAYRKRIERVEGQPHIWLTVPEILDIYDRRIVKGELAKESFDPLLQPSAS